MQLRRPHPAMPRRMQRRFPGMRPDPDVCQTFSPALARLLGACLHPEKRLGHKTRDPIPKSGSVTKLETPVRHGKLPSLFFFTDHPRKRRGAANLRVLCTAPLVAGAAVVVVDPGVARGQRQRRLIGLVHTRRRSKHSRLRRNPDVRLHYALPTWRWLA